MNTYVKEMPNEMTQSFNKLSIKLNINKISEILIQLSKKSNFVLENQFDELSENVKAIRTMSDMFHCPLSDSVTFTLILVTNDDFVRQSVAEDLLSISEKCLSDNNFQIMLKNNPNFVKKYSKVYFEKICSEKVIENDLCQTIVKIFVNNYKKYENFCENIHKIVDNTWPSLDVAAKLAIVSDMIKVPRSEGLETPGSWMKSFFAEDHSLQDKMKMIVLLPGGQEYSDYYRQLAGDLPNRLSELRDEQAAIFRALLDALSNTGDMILLGIICTLASADDTCGWWDDAIDVCMQSLAARKDETIYKIAYNYCKKGFGVTRRVFVPLLRYAPRLYIEQYISTIIPDLLSTFKTVIVSVNTDAYRDRVISYTRACVILQAIIEKVPLKSLESGVINISAGSQNPWHFVKEVCKYTMTLRDKVQCPDDATDALKDVCLRFQCSAYNCLTTAICKRRPPKGQYRAIFDPNAWSKIVNHDMEYEFPARAYWNDYSLKKKMDGSVSSSSSFTTTARTRIFMTTLSENPLQYDMIANDDDEEEEEVEDVPQDYSSHPLNVNGCLATITSLLQHATTLDHTEWLPPLIEGLKNGPVNSKWMLAQAICYAELDLKPHAKLLVPILLQLVVNTSKMNEKAILNNLHIDILWTIIKWNIIELKDFIDNENGFFENLNTVIKCLISTSIEHRAQRNVFNRLLSTIDGLLKLYVSDKLSMGDIIQEYLVDFQNTSSFLLPILQRLLKNKVKISNLLPTLLSLESKEWISASRIPIPTVYGLALSLETNKDDFLSKFWQILDNVKEINKNSYIKTLLYATRACFQCCNENNFRIITDFAAKVEKPRCLTIISIYLEHLQDDDGSIQEMLKILALQELLDGEHPIEAMKVVYGGLKFIEDDMKRDIMMSICNYCKNTSIPIRKQAFTVVLKVFQDIVLTKDAHPSKKRALDSTPILNTMNDLSDYNSLIIKELALGLFDSNAEISSLVREGIEICLSKDIIIRYAELFYIIFYFDNNINIQLSDCVSVFLEMLLKDLKDQEGFKDNLLSDIPLPVSDLNTFTTLTVSGMKMKQKQGNNLIGSRQINVQMPISNILDTFLQASKVNSQICLELCVQITKRLQGPGRRFDLDSVIAKMLPVILERKPNNLTPMILEIARIFINNKQIDGLKKSINILKNKVKNSEGEDYLNILFEDLVLREKGRNFFDFSIKEETDIEMREEEESIKGLQRAFLALSNWDDIRIQDKKCIEQSLPPLLFKENDFESSIKQYFEEGLSAADYNHWFNKMAATYYCYKYDETLLQYKEKWLKDINMWPRREFKTSAVLETMKLSEEDCVQVLDIKSTDCLAEWAGRLMLKSAYYRDDESNAVICRKEELKWCIEANRRNLPYQALQCIERNKRNLLEDEALSWFHEKVIAQRLIAIRNNDHSMLHRALEAAEKQQASHMISLQEVILQLHNDLGVLTKPKLDFILHEINREEITKENSMNLTSIYNLSMEYYDGLWEDYDESNNLDILNSMFNIIKTILDNNLSKNHNLSLSIFLVRLSTCGFILQEDIAKKILQMIATLLPNLDIFTKSFIKNTKNVFPEHIWEQYDLDTLNMNTTKLYLELICDPQYLLVQYCRELLFCKDPEKWNAILNKMKCKLFDTSYGGTDYITLNTYKNKLISIENTESKIPVLTTIVKELESKLRSELRISQLSPELLKPGVLEGQRKSLRRLLALPPNVYVVKFVEQIQVFTRSIRRPCVITAVLSNGLKKRYIVKVGEPLVNDAAVQRVIKVLPLLQGGDYISYNVTVLSEDAAIIEYLEDYQTLNDLMGNNITRPDNYLKDDKMVFSPTLALEQYNNMCNKIPVYKLRSAIENTCASTEEFINKRNKYLSTLSAMTIINWLFGVGDRHLENIMISSEGAVCSVDWATVFQYGLREYMPARLTANILAVCNITVLESRLQNILENLRKNHKLYESFIKISFYWKEADFNEMYYIKDILEGKKVSYEITKDVFNNNNKIRHREEIIKILDTVFEDFEHKQTYSVEEQVTCLLKHCTAPQLLAVTPIGWQSWV
ncbi:uncharacterized protein LOC142985326 [Anticarsia gemmatalis]|uniref:uncharacterized protein LOC142985326 n=1 Tax=Anticarsia gemmatalis TaxID=129554 RepID=UPI003F7689DB